YFIYKSDLHVCVHITEAAMYMYANIETDWMIGWSAKGPKNTDYLLVQGNGSMEILKIGKESIRQKQKRHEIEILSQKIISSIIELRESNRYTHLSQPHHIKEIKN
ncbi:hypothetical protein ACJX0J_022505, partial [Zea mays]